MSFPATDCELRTDLTFRNRSIPAHHREYSIIEELPIDMITDFVVSDSLHLLHLGVMKKCLLLWLHGSQKFEYKWSQNDIANLNILLKNCDKEIPTDIHRSVRDINCIKFWKGTEFRTFLCYVGVVVLQQVLRTEEYEHFLHLFCAVTLCSHNEYLQNIEIAEELFNEYIENYINLYGIDAIGSNVHNLSHIVNDVRRFGNLSNIETYMYENTLFSLKLRLRNCNRPLEQISRRIEELNLDFRNPIDINYEQNNITFTPDVKYPFKNDNTNHLFYSYISLGTDSFLCSRKWGDKWFLTKDDNIVEFLFSVKQNEKYFLNGLPLKNKTNFFVTPFSSHIINIYLADSDKLEARYYSIEDVKAKMVCLSYKNQFVLLPLLHTLK